MQYSTHDSQYTSTKQSEMATRKEGVMVLFFVTKLLNESYRRTHETAWDFLAGARSLGF